MMLVFRNDLLILLVLLILHRSLLLVDCSKSWFRDVQPVQFVATNQQCSRDCGMMKGLFQEFCSPKSDC